VQQELDPLKQELFAYLETLPEKTRTLLRIRHDVINAGFGEHLNVLYGGSWFKASEDFQFYQFVRTAQSYSSASSPEEMRMLESRFLQYALDLAGAFEDVYLLSMLGEEGQERYRPALEAIKAYIKGNPPVYDETYKAGMLQAVPPELKLATPRKMAGHQLLKEQVEEVLSTLTERERGVLQLRFGLEDRRSRTLEEVGQHYSIASEEVEQIETEALRKLRHPSRIGKLRDFLE